MSLAVPPDCDDDDDSAVKRARADVQPRRRLRASAAARLLHGRRPGLESDVDAVHDAGDLSLSRQVPGLVAWRQGRTTTAAGSAAARGRMNQLSAAVPNYFLKYCSCKFPRCKHVRGNVAIRLRVSPSERNSHRRTR